LFVESFGKAGENSLQSGFRPHPYALLRAAADLQCRSAITARLKFFPIFARALCGLDFSLQLAAILNFPRPSSS
jgi:hypothetical protein